ncbi:MAG: PLP-dependent aminotransferase family protein, partial [Paraburkholderia sp.]|uniref:aminotransferase-like domain-containing protein n=1 Tax=Paraburkholderia sp. TaxID=1926495 RepID=UPI003C50C8D2
LPAGTRMPSVRQLARDHNISPFSAAEIYNALVAGAVLEARAGTGYFIPNRLRAPAAVPGLDFAADSVWERRREASDREIKLDAGCGWLPGDWLYTDGVRTALRALARQSSLHLEGYGNPLGLGELRTHISKLLELRGITAPEEHIVLTQGASQALDLVVRECLEPGDTAIVEDPGYPPLFELLRSRGVHMLALPRTQNGPDTDVLATLLRRHRVKCLFTNTAFHNPTGTTTNSATAHRLLELANRQALTIIEDDSFADLAPCAQLTLASLDELQRVIYISSFSKTLSPALRSGYLVATRSLAQKLARVKVMTSLGSSELLEQIVLQILTRGRYRRHLNNLHDRLAAAHARVTQALGARGVEFAFRPQPGLFLWATLPSLDSVSKLWHRALDAGVLLAPGELFRPDGCATAHWRFNIAQCDAPILYGFLDTLRPARNQ